MHPTVRRPGLGGYHTETFKIRQLKCSPSGVSNCVQQIKVKQSRSAVNITGESDIAGPAAQLLPDQQGAPLHNAEAQMALQQVLTTPHEGQHGWHGALCLPTCGSNSSASWHSPGGSAQPLKDCRLRGRLRAPCVTEITSSSLETRMLQAV